MQVKIDDLNKNMPKKIAKRMAKEEKRRQEGEMMDNERKDKNKCTIS